MPATSAKNSSTSGYARSETPSRHRNACCEQGLGRVTFGVRVVRPRTNSNSSVAMPCLRASFPVTTGVRYVIAPPRASWKVISASISVKPLTAAGKCPK